MRRTLSTGQAQDQVLNVLRRSPECLPFRFAIAFLILKNNNTSATTAIIEIMLNATRPYVALSKFDVILPGVEAFVAATEKFHKRGNIQNNSKRV